MSTYVLSEKELKVKNHWLIFNLVVVFLYPLLNFSYYTSTFINPSTFFVMYGVSMCWFAVLYYWAYVRERSKILFSLLVVSVIGLILFFAGLFFSIDVERNRYLLVLDIFQSLYATYILYQLYKLNKRIQTHNLINKVPDTGRYGYKSTTAFLLLFTVLPTGFLIYNEALKQLELIKETRKSQESFIDYEYEFKDDLETF